MFTLEELVKVHTGWMEGYLHDFGLEKEFHVSKEIHDGPLQKDLSLGLYSVNDNLFALMLGGHESNVQMMLLPAEIPLFASSSSLATNFYYTVINKTIIPVAPDQPTSMNGVYLSQQPNMQYHGPKKPLITSSEIAEYCFNKSLAKKLLQEAGIRTPKAMKVTGRSGEQKVYQFMKDSKEFVIKPVDGSCGSGVRMYYSYERPSAWNYITEITEKKDVLLEERVHAIPWKENGVEYDWNIRALVLLAEKPIYLDAEVRFAKKNGMPVNISRSADAMELIAVARKLGFEERIIQDHALKSASVIGKRFPCHPYALLGIDIMLTESGPYTIEINAGAVGGFSTLTKLRQAPLKTINDIFVPGITPFLSQCRNKKSKRVDQTITTSLEHLYRASVALALEQPQKAKEILLRSLQKLDDKYSWKMLGEVYEKMNRPRLALDAWKKALALDLDFQSAFLNKSCFLAKNHRWKSLLHFLGSYSHRYGDTPVYWNDLGVCHEKLKNPQTALENYKHAIEIDPTFSLALHNTARLLSKRGEHEEALQYAKQSTIYDSANPYFHDTLGMSFYNLKRFELSLQSLEKAIALEPTISTFWYHISQTLFALDRGEEAVDHLKAGLVHSPHNPTLNAHLGRFLTLSDDPFVRERGIEHLSMAVEGDTTYAWAWDSLGIAYQQTEQWEAASECYKRSLFRYPKDQQVRYNLAIVYTALEHPRKALQELKTIIHHDSTTVIAQLAKSMMGGTYYSLGYKTAGYKAASSIDHKILKDHRKNLPEMNIKVIVEKE